MKNGWVLGGEQLNVGSIGRKGRKWYNSNFLIILRGFGTFVVADAAGEDSVCDVSITVAIQSSRRRA